MKCPVCQKNMLPQDFSGVQVDICKDGCKGMWFDWGELQKLDEINEGLGQAMREALVYERHNDGNRGQINCPRCDFKMHVHKYDSAKEVNIDECYQCGGFFLDSGELNQIRDNFMSEQERDLYVSKLLMEMPDFKQAEQDLVKEKKRVEAILNLTRFMRISYYVTGR